MIRLALDTSDDCAHAAAGSAAADAAVEVLAGARQHARALPGLLQESLERRGVPLGSVVGIVLAAGPGSFTGLRVGASVAKALVRSLAIPLLAADSLLARAWAAGADGRTTAVLLDALRGEAYVAVYRCHTARVETVVPPVVLSARAAAEHCRRAERSVVQAGAALTAALAEHGAPTAAPLLMSPAAALLDLATVPGGAQVVPAPDAWEPAYGRQAEAQARWEETHGRPLPDPARALR